MFFDQEVVADYLRFRRHLSIGDDWTYQKIGQSVLSALLAAGWRSDSLCL